MNDRMSAFSATIADVDPWTGYQLSDLMLGLLAERAAKDVIVHCTPPSNRHAA